MFQWVRDWCQSLREGGTESPESEPTRWSVSPWHVCRIGDEFYVASYDTYQRYDLHIDDIDGFPVVSRQEGRVVVYMSIGDKDQIDVVGLEAVDRLGLIKVDEIRFTDRMSRADIQRLESIAFVSKYNNDLANWLAGQK